MDIEIKNISKRFGGYTALKDVSLTVHPGELVALLGPSGSGKTTLLRIIAGLERATSGMVLFGGENALDRSIRQRRVGFVFQHYALFRHMTVFENVAFGLRVKPRGPSAARSGNPGQGRHACSIWSSSITSPSATRRSSRAASASGWRWPGRWPSSRRCCCSTSRSARWTRRCARNCGAGCATCTTRCS